MTSAWTDPPADPAEPTGSAAVVSPGIVVSPVLVVTQSFDARPASLPDASAFVRSALAGATIDEADLRAVNTAITDALLIAAGPSIGTFQVVVRLFPDDVEIEVLSSGDSQFPRAATPQAADASFAQWFSDVLRRQGLSQEAAARHLGVSVRTVSRWVRGQTEPRLRDVRRISGVFGPVPHRHL
jgi:DNA-binding XRE family transcriptional regulator